MKEFKPDYKHIVNAANNIEASRLPLYEHLISDEVMEAVLGRKFRDLINGNISDVDEYFKNYCEFFKVMGYDTVSFEACVGQAMPGSGSLGGHKPGEIRDRQDFERYPWEQVPELYFEKYSHLFKALRSGRCSATSNSPTPT
jgi:uroporphyrinogen decarboxylase